MPKSARRRELRRPAELPNAFVGQIAEICRDLAVQAKRMRQLEEQAEELRALIRQWVDQFEGSYGEPATRGARRSQAKC